METVLQISAGVKDRSDALDALQKALRSLRLNLKKGQLRGRNYRNITYIGVQKWMVVLPPADSHLRSWLIWWI